ncbi:hypothetical protein AAG906_009775 [Vitis piasezkii]
MMHSVLSPVLNMPISESKRQRVLQGQKATSKQYLEAILPPFVAILRRWRPLADALPIEVTGMNSAAFPFVCLFTGLPLKATTSCNGISDDWLGLVRKTVRLHTFSSFQKPLEPSKSPATPKDKAAAKAAALAAVVILKQCKDWFWRGLSAVAMATSVQRRNTSDMERVRRWNVSDAMGTAWMECLQSADTRSVYGKDFNNLSYKFVAVLVASFALARNMQRSEVQLVLLWWFQLLIKVYQNYCDFSNSFYF